MKNSRTEMPGADGADGGDRTPESVTSPTYPSAAANVVQAGQGPSTHSWQDRVPSNEDGNLNRLDSAAEAITLTPPDNVEQPAPSRAVVPAPAGYEIIAELGRGGMGVVYKARHDRLRRLVALKMVLTGAHASAGELTRFRREAELAASLQHPNIVQIYEVGEADGCPFLALEFMEGGSLAARLDGTPQPPRPAAHLVEILARAVHVAHRHGIIHRDLKPGNILLAPAAPGSESSASTDSWLTTAVPKITDFGLARRLDDSAGPTVSGAIMGTPSYMAPEQAAGKGREAGPATDVYALGAILYELLTGRPPFKAPTSFDTTMQVLTDDPVPPRRLQPKVPRDLEIICMKCLQKDPRRRYADAEALAEDLRRFGANESIVARPAGRVELAVKWARRKPATAGLVGVSLAAIFALFVIGLVYQLKLWRSNTRLSEALQTVTQEKEKAEKEHDRAQAHLGKALEVVDHILTHVWDEPIGNSPSTLALRKRLLQDASEYYQWNLDQQDQDPVARRETARACFRTAGLHLWLGNTVQAETYGKQAVDLQKQLVAEFPVVPEYRHDLSKTYTYLGHTYAMTQRFDRAAQAYGQSIALVEKLVAEHAATSEYIESLARSHLDLALFNIFSNLASAEQHCQSAVALSERLYHDYPKSVDYQCLLAGCYGALATIKAARGRLGEAEEPIKKGLELLLPPGREPPRAGQDYGRALAGLKFYEGVVLLQKRRVQEAEASLKEGISGFERLVEHSPIFPYRWQLSMCYPILGQLYDDAGRQALAEEMHRKARTSIIELAREYPSATFLKPLVTDRRVLSMVYQARRRDDIPKLLTEADALAQEKDLSALSAYNLACLYAVASAATPGDPSAAAVYAEKAMKFLVRAEEGGFFKRGFSSDLLRRDADLNSIRARDDFKALLKRTGSNSPKSNREPASGQAPKP
jgi:tetratricopeptide (TPR) repeat protein